MVSETHLVQRMHCCSILSRTTADEELHTAHPMHNTLRAVNPCRFQPTESYNSMYSTSIPVAKMVAIVLRVFEAPFAGYAGPVASLA